MSFILDALRKAEHGHQSAPAPAAPILPADVPAAPPNPRRRMLLIGGALAAIVTLLAAFALLRPPPPPATPAATAQTLAPPPAVERPAPPPRRIASASEARQPVRALDLETRRPDPASVRATPVVQRPTAIQPGTVTVMEPEQLAAATTAPLPAAAPAGNDADPYAGLPEYQSLLREGRINLPNLSLNMHVYNANPAKRFVFVNLKKYREGDMVEGRASVEAITAQGAVLNNNGTRFMLRPE